MFFSPHRLPIPWLGVALALAGAVFCFWTALPSSTSVPCPTVGCRLFQDVTISGISLWWAGVAYFSVMTLLCLKKAWRAYLLLGALALLGDAVLLIIMLVTAPCLACLGVALLIGLLFLVLYRHAHSRNARGWLLAFLLWAGLFLAVVASAGGELLGSWQLSGPVRAERRVYFSPSCPACRDAVAVFGESAAFFPVAEREEDYAAIYRMKLALDAGKTLAEALAVSGAGAEAPYFSIQGALFRLRLLRNKAEVLNLGFSSLPLIITGGMPKGLRPEPAAMSAEPPVRQRQEEAALPPELSPLDSCGEGALPCDTPPGMTPH